MACWLVATLSILGILALIWGIALMGALLAWVYINFLGEMAGRYPTSFAIIVISLVVGFLFICWVSLYISCIKGG